SMTINYRQERVTQMARPLSLAYALTGERVYAQKAALILARLAEVYPNYPVHGLGQGFASADHRGFYENHFYREPPFPFVSARWGNFHDSPFADAGRAFQAAQAYDLILDSGALGALSAQAGRNVQEAIERDLLYEAARHTLDTPFRSTNYDGSRIVGLGLVGRMLGEPDFVRHAYDLYRTLIDNGFCHDGYWHEDTLNYFSMIVGGVLRVPEVLSGPGGIDVLRDMPFLPRLLTAPLGLYYPDGRGIPVNDSWSQTTLPRAGDVQAMGRLIEVADEILGRSRIPAADPEFALFRRVSEVDRRCSKAGLLPLVPENVLLPGSGEAVLGVGRSPDAARAHLTFGPWAGHHHRDTLSFSLYAFGQELISDIGYTWTVQRPWSTSVASHNTVVVDGQEQTEAGGRLLAYRPASEAGVGFVSAEAPGAFRGARVYRRSVLFAPTGSEAGFIVDLFDVEGGETYDYWLHGAADFDQGVETDVALRPSEGELVSGGGAGEARYDFLRNVREADLKGDVRLRLKGEETCVDLWFSGADGGRLLVAEGPSVRRAEEDDARLSRFWFPAICLRRAGGQSRFLSVIAAQQGEGEVPQVERIPCEGRGVVLRITDRGRSWVIGIDPEGEGLSARLPDGRDLELAGRAGVGAEVEGKVTLYLVDGSRLRVGDRVHEQVRGYEGVLTGVVGDLTGEPGRSELLTDVALPEGEALAGKVVYVAHPTGAETAYLIERVVREGAVSRVCLAGMPRFLWGRGTVASGGVGRFESSLEHPKGWDYGGRRVRVGGRVFTVREVAGLTTFLVAEAFDFSGLAGESFVVFSTAAGDRFRIVN
ncbi:heparinase II/III family protein, partial [bacterium]|nr:heparinase II/III family protein [bacterium]